MRNILLVVVVIVFGIFLVAFTNKGQTETTQVKGPEDTPSNVVFQEYKAEFEIITNGTARIFTDPKYHSLSPNVYIEKENPNAVIVKTENIKWSDFFATLPMKLDKNCLTTGTGQTFCTGNGKYLKFFINGIENPTALDETIKNNDSLQITFE